MDGFIKDIIIDSCTTYNRKCVNIKMNDRNYGLDLLRMVAMYMVLLLHVLGQGGILKELPPQGTNVYLVKYAMAWYVEIFAYCAVNCYALLTGYNYFDKTISNNKIVSFWLQIIFYALGINLIFYFCGSKITSEMWLMGFFPITTRVYWYATAYFGLFFLIPLFNKSINELSIGNLKQLLYIMFVVFSFISTLIMKDPYNLNRGYSLIWLLLLFVVGGALKRLDICNKISSKISFQTFFVAISFTWIWKLIFDICYKKYIVANMFIRYTSPTIVLAAIALFIYFSKIRINQTKIRSLISRLSAAAFGVYLIHLHPLIWRGAFRGFSKVFVKQNAAVKILEVLLSALAIYIVCTFIEILRIKLFNYLTTKNLLKNTL